VEIKILEDRPNPLLKRHEYRFEVDHATAATPSRDAVRSELSKLVKAPKDRVIIERMGARYGTAVTQGDALVYETADVARSITREHILVRNGLKEKSTPGAGAPGGGAAAKEEPPAKPTPSEAPAVEARPPEPPAAPAEAKPEHKPEHKSEHKPEPKAEQKSEHKAEHKPEHKPKTDAEPKGAHEGEAKAEAHKGEHKPRAAKADKGEKTEKPAAEGGA
jgi:small subunit ribosomal protein S24e